MKKTRKQKGLKNNYLSPCPNKLIYKQLDNIHNSINGKVFILITNNNDEIKQLSSKAESHKQKKGLAGSLAYDWLFCTSLICSLSQLCGQLTQQWMQDQQLQQHKGENMDVPTLFHMMSRMFCVVLSVCFMRSISRLGCYRLVQLRSCFSKSYNVFGLNADLYC